MEVLDSQEKNGANILVLKKNFLSSKQAANESVEEFKDRIKSAREDIEQGGSKITDEDTSMTILFGLLPQYENFVQFMTMMKKNIILDDVVSELLAEDKRRKNKQSNNSTASNEMVFHSKGRSSNFNNNNDNNFKNNNNDNFKKKKSKDVRCFNCDKVGYYARNCRLPKND